MKRESFSEKVVEKKDLNEAAAEHLEKMAEFLKVESELLNQEGFPVAEDCRLDVARFEGLYSHDSIQRDQEKVSRIESHFGESQQEEIAELLEAAKTLVFNKFWFGGRLVAVRTSRFDDYVNGIDQLILDRETFQPLAAVDTTLDWKSKLPKIMNRIQKGGSMKYGVGMSESGISKTAQSGLPIFIISLKGEEVLELARGIEAGELTGEAADLERVVAEELSRQSNQLANLTIHDKVCLAYRSANKLFSEL